jgi:hypothetical protein
MSRRVKVVGVEKLDKEEHDTKRNYNEVFNQALVSKSG